VVHIEAFAGKRHKLIGVTSQSSTATSNGLSKADARKIPFSGVFEPLREDVPKALGAVVEDIGQIL
jgi:hypothetical protein